MGNGWNDSGGAGDCAIVLNYAIWLPCSRWKMLLGILQIARHVQYLLLLISLLAVLEAAESKMYVAEISIERKTTIICLQINDYICPVW